MAPEEEICAPAMVVEPAVLATTAPGATTGQLVVRSVTALIIQGWAVKCE